jgi:5-methylcytosine-specific restriction enzyme A
MLSQRCSSAAARGESAGIMCGASQAGQPLYRLARRQIEYSRPGNRNMSQSTSSTRIEPFVYVRGSPVVPHCVQTIMVRPLSLSAGAVSVDEQGAKAREVVEGRMPEGALHQCNGAGCRTLVPYRERWCPACKAEHQRADTARRGDARTERGYDWRWRRYREAFLKRHPLCSECQRQGRTTAARVVDHIRPHKGDQALFWDPKNHQSLCDYTSPWNCHGRKTALEDGGFGRPVRASQASAAPPPPGRGAPAGGEGGDPSLGRLAAPPAPPSQEKNVRFRIRGGRVEILPEPPPAATRRHRG